MPQLSAAPVAPDRYANPAYRWYAVLVMMGVYLCHALDRSMAGILVEPIKAEFGLTDTQAGLYAGTGYGLAFAIFVVPMGLLSDRVNRRNLLAALVATWSICTALGGFARNCGQLVVARMGVGAAEAGSAPLAMPMLSDIFPAGRRSFVVGIFYMSTNVGSVLASVAGGYIAAEHGWRTALLVAGLPGLFFAVLLLLTVQEPRRGGAEQAGAEGLEKAASPREVARFLVRNPAVVALIVGCGLLSLLSVTFGAWSASFFIRAHGLSLAEAGLLLGLGGGAAGTCAPPIFGWLGDKLAARHGSWPLRLVWCGALIAICAGMMMLFVPVLAVAALGYAIGEFMRSGYPPTSFGVLMTQSPVRMRGAIMALVQFASVFLGWGMGPLFIGLLSDLYGGGLGIRYALANALLLYLPAAGLFLYAQWKMFPNNPARRSA